LDERPNQLQPESPAPSAAYPRQPVLGFRHGRMQACCQDENGFTSWRLRLQVIESRRNANRPQRSMRRELRNRPIVAPRKRRTVEQLLERVSESRTLARARKPRQPVQPAYVQALAPQLPSLSHVGSRISTMDDYFVEQKRFSHDRVCLRTAVGVVNPRPTRGLDFGGRDGVCSGALLNTW
jgi:hypothetical protein